MDVAERIALGFVEAERHRRTTVPGAMLLEIDGLLIALANVRDPAVNSTLVIREPADPRAALAAAERIFREHDRPFGIDLAVGRHPAVDRAVREAGLRLLFTWPALGVSVDGLPDPTLPEGVIVRPVENAGDAAALAVVDQAAFGDGPEVAEQFYAAGSFGVDGARSFVAWLDGEPVGIASAHVYAFAIGILGVAVVPTARRRGIGTALTLTAARAFPADVAWLHTSDDGARVLYERLGFVAVADWEVWVRDG